MKKMNRWMMAVILCCGLGATLTSCSVSDNSNPPTPPTPPAEVDYTVMLYTTGGENLDLHTEYDFVDACKGLKGNETRVRFFVQFKCSSQEGLNKQAEEFKKEYPGQEYTWITGKPGALYRAELTSNMYKDNWISQFTDKELWGDQQKKSQMYQPDSIASFIKYCAQAAPAKNYVLIVSDHGSGYHVYFDYLKNTENQSSAPARRAVCSDAFNDNMDITIKELREGIQKSGVHLKLLNFDDCLMNCVEVISEFTDVCDYMLGSNHTTIGGGYSQFVNHLAKAGASGDFVGEMKVYQDEFIAKYKDMKEDNDAVQKKYPGSLKHCAYALTDLTKFKAVLPAVKVFVNKLISEALVGTLTAEQQKIAASKCYQPKVGYPYYDLLNYAYQLQVLDANLTTEYEAMKQAVEAALLKQAYTPVLQEYLNTADVKQVSYNVNLGATVTDSKDATKMGTILRIMDANEEGDVACLDENGYIWWFTPSDNIFTYQSQNPMKNRAWTNGYGLSTFVQQTGWTTWLRMNVGFPTKNPPYNFE